MEIGGKYNWKHQDERLVYLGKKGFWHHFALISKPNTTWCKVLEEDLRMIEKTKECKVIGGHIPGLGD